MPVTPDPYAAYGGSVAQGGGADPYAAYGGSVAAPPPPQGDTRSLLQKAKDNFNAATQGAKPGDGAVKSFVEDVGAGGGDVVRALAHPLRTIDAITSTADPVVDYLAGNKDRAIQNAQNAPGLARTIGQMGAGAIIGEGAGRVLQVAVPVAAKIAGRAVLLGKTPESAYESALKPSTALSQSERAAIVKTGLENEVPVSKGGVEALGNLIDDYNQKIKDTIAADPNRPIDPNKVATRADAAKAKFANQVNAQGDLNAIDASKQQFLAEQGQKSAIGPNPTGLFDAQGNPIMTKGTPAQAAPPMNAADAQIMKQGTYRVLQGKFGEQGSAAVEAQKALARGLKEEIASQFPEINDLNATESRLLNLQPVLERAVNRISNHQAIGIGTPVAGAAAKAVTGSGSVGVVASTLKAVLDNPEMKSRLAIAVSKGAKIPYSQALSRVQSYSAALGSAAAGSLAYSSGDNPSQPTTPQP